MERGNASQRFRAFISYSHKDKAYAEQLHQQLEKYKVPKDLRSPEAWTHRPDRLGKFFRDRKDLPASPDLVASIHQALAASEFLIVLCSPDAAKSPHVEDEVTYFKDLGRGDQIISLIVPESPLVGVKELFPPSLPLHFDPDGMPTGGTREPAAADARPGGDGREQAFMRVVANLLRTRMDILQDRHADVLRKEARVAWAIVLALLVLLAGAIAGGSLAYMNGKRAEQNFEQAVDIASVTLKQAGAFANHYGVPRDAAASMLRAAEERFQLLADEKSAGKKLRLSFVELEAGFSDHYKSIGDTGAQLRAAERARMRVLDVEADWHEDPEVLRHLGMAYEVLGHAYLARKDTATALDSFKKSVQAHERAVKLTPQDQNLLVSLGLARGNVGEALKTAGRYGEALPELQAALGLVEQVRGSPPDSPQDLAAVAGLHQRIAMMQRHLGRTVESVQTYELALALFGELRRREPTQRAHLLSISEIWQDLAQLRQDQRQFVEAEAAYKQYCQTADELVNADPANATFHVSAFWCHYRLGELREDQGQPTEALAEYLRALDINTKFLSRDPESSQRMREGVVARTQAGSNLLDLHRYKEAEHYLQEADQLLQKLLASDPTDLDSIACEAANDLMLGLALAQLNQPDAARKRLEHAVSRSELLVEREPGDIYHQVQLADRHLELARFEAAQGRKERARTLFGQVLEAASRPHPASQATQWATLEAQARVGLGTRSAALTE